MRRARRIGGAAAVAVLLAAPALTSPVAAQTSVHIAGEVGETVDPDATNGGVFLRYVGDPAPEGYSHAYQWANPFIEAGPEAGPVVFEGTLDLTQRQSDNSVAMIGLLDKAALETGATDFQRGAYIYVNNRTNGTVRIGVTDGNVGGEIVQTFVVISAAAADAGPLNVSFTVDGTADPLSCDVPPDSGGAGDGCLTLEIDGFPPLTDSYGTITGNASGNEFASGAIAGWESFPSGPHGVFFDFTVSPVTSDPQNKDQCKDGGWQSFGFANQGQCIRFVSTGNDSR